METRSSDGDPGTLFENISRRPPKPGELQGIILDRSPEVGRDKILTVVIPWIKEVPASRSTYEDKGFRAVTVRDTFHVGYVVTVNVAATFVETEWMLLWNSDAIALFNAEAFEKQLSELPPEVMIAAPAKVADGTETRVHTEERGRGLGPSKLVHTHVLMIDTGPFWVGMPIEASEIYPSMMVAGSSYSPLFAVRTGWFRSLGGFSMLYHPGYYEDAHFWKLTRRMGGVTVVLPGFTYTHKGQSSFRAIYTDKAMLRHQEENLTRYLLSWGMIEPSAIST